MPANLYMLSLRLEFAEVFMLEERIEGCCTMVTAIKVLIFGAVLLGKGQVDIFAYGYNIF